MNVFERYAPFIQDYIYRSGWQMLRGVQNAAGEAIFGAEENVLLTASTASGKTEAAFFPVPTLMEEDPLDRQCYDEVLATAGKRGSTFVPVFLTASDAAHAARIPSAEREERMKMTDAEGAARKRNSTRLLEVDHPNRLDLDTTHLVPGDAARIIVEHAESCAGISRAR